MQPGSQPSQRSLSAAPWPRDRDAGNAPAALRGVADHWEVLASVGIVRGGMRVGDGCIGRRGILSGVG
jgi:hypothetical protein